MDLFLLLPAVSPVALYLTNEFVPTIRYIVGAVRRTNSRKAGLTSKGDLS